MSDKNKKPKQPGRKKFWIASVFCKYFNTVLIGFIVLCAAQGWVFSLAIMGVALCLDLVRQRISPDLQGGMEGLATFHQRASENEEKLKREIGGQRKLFYGFGLAAFGYAIGLIAIDHYLSEGTLAPYLDAMAFLTDGGRLFFPIVSDHMAQLQDAGYPFRAMFAGHIYSFCGFSLIVAIVWSSFGLLYQETVNHKFSAERRMEKIKRKNPKANTDFREKDFGFFRGFWIFSIGLFFSYFIFNFLNPITWENTSSLATSWNVADSDTPFVLQVLISASLIILSTFAYISAQFFRFDYAKQILKTPIKLTEKL